MHLLSTYTMQNANCLIPEQQFARYHFWKMLGQTCIYYTRSCGLGLESEKRKPRINLSGTESSYKLLLELISTIYLYLKK